MTRTWLYADVHDPDDPLTALRIPVVATAVPRYSYIVALDSDPACDRPTDAEAALLRSFLDHYINFWYTPTWKAKLAAQPFDVDDGANGYVFRKFAADDWGYRQRSWMHGPLYWPGPDWYRAKYGKDLGARQHSLAKLVDHIHGRDRGGVSASWREWKNAHPEVFGS